MKIALVGSSGGHLAHLMKLSPMWEKNERFWVTFEKEDAQYLLKNENWYKAYYPTNRNFINLIRNFFLAIRILRRERPDLIISSGAAVAVPFFWLAKFFGAKTIYIEVFDRMDKPTLTGKLVYHFADRFIVQWPEMKNVYKKAIVIEGLFL
ncbi:PssD/Cps14F family polysaccharide biosynthesis glycosyltransferase [Weissella confusa]|uniref:UDP-N-acetylglucosamine--LPS N-acetylglucosamine transferase n=1 Tax=Weissella confusa TaxID=1583 RepID=A0A4Z0RYU6_WEICO|nr:PssD/Cps14F family polysaccharide biosynthesis glycosyltransferase [Weissella confusa]TGE71791.1 UDP-N-acetylglucosamine--LPS N-acetylglucosamine transferase [Weissella confusa]